MFYKKFKTDDNDCISMQTFLLLNNSKEIILSQLITDGDIDDENNPNNYFIDFEINRLSGNLPEDYYQPVSNTSYPNYDQTQYQNINNSPNNN